MRILMLGWELPPYNSGGLGVACYELARALADRGAQIDFVLPHARIDGEPERAFMNVHYVPEYTDVPSAKKFVAGSLEKVSGIPAQPHAYTGDIDAVRQAQQQYIEFLDKFLADQLREQPDVIHAHDWLTYDAGVHAKKLTGMPLVAHVHATEFDRGGGDYGNPMIHEIEYNGLVMADRIIAVSEITKQLIVDRYKIPAEKIEVAHNSVDQNGIISQDLPEQTLYTYARSMQQEGYKVIVTIGRLTIQKGLIQFLHAAQKSLSRYDKLLFIVAGDGDQRNELIQLSADLGISRNILFTGFLRGAAWRELYDVADIFVMNSISEPFGLTALEAAIQDTAVLLSRQSGVGEVLTNVLKHDYWDTDRLADEIIAVASSDALKQELAAGAKANFGNVSWDRAAEICSHQYRIAGAAS